METVEQAVRVVSILFILIALPFVTLGGVTAIGLPFVAYRRRLRGHSWFRAIASIIFTAFLGLAAHVLLYYLLAYFMMGSRIEIKSTHYYLIILAVEGVFLLIADRLLI